LPLTARKFDTVLVVVDKLSKMAHFIPTSHNITACETAWLFVTNIFRLHGMPHSIISDRDGRFTSDFWQALFDILGCSLRMSSSYHPQTDGQSERTIQVLLQMIRATCRIHNEKWDLIIPLLEFPYNNAVHCSTHMTPFYMNYAQHPHVPLTLSKLIPRNKHLSDNQRANQLTKHLSQILHDARTSLTNASATQKRYADKKRRNVSYNVGDEVLLSTKHLPQYRNCRKVRDIYIGPFKIIKRIGEVSYKLDLNHSDICLHDVVHIQYLRPYKHNTMINKDAYKSYDWIVIRELLKSKLDTTANTSTTDTINNNNTLTIDTNSRIKEECIIDKRVLQRDKRRVTQYLVKYKDKSIDESKWINASDLSHFNKYIKLYENGYRQTLYEYSSVVPEPTFVW